MAAGDVQKDPAGGHALVAERPSGRWYCVTHLEETTLDDCCRWTACCHVPRCDLRRLLIEAANDAAREGAS